MRFAVAVAVCGVLGAFACGAGVSADSSLAMILGAVAFGVSVPLSVWMAWASVMEEEVERLTRANAVLAESAEYWQEAARLNRK